MKTIRQFLCIFFLLSIIMANARTQHLNTNWKFRQNGKTEWHQATVPGTVHTDLMACGMLPDPFIGENERLVQWVDKEDWTYETVFDTDPEIYACNNIELAFEGLDTYADVYVNDSLILKADNMFRSWNIPVKEILKPDGNRLRILFHSPLKIDIPKYEALGLRYPYPASNDQSENGGVFNKKVSVFARKAGYHYGWDCDRASSPGNLAPGVAQRMVGNGDCRCRHNHTVRFRQKSPHES